MVKHISLIDDATLERLKQYQPIPGKFAPRQIQIEHLIETAYILDTISAVMLQRMSRSKKPMPNFDAIEVPGKVAETREWVGAESWDVHLKTWVKRQIEYYGVGRVLIALGRFLDDNAALLKAIEVTNRGVTYNEDERELAPRRHTFHPLVRRQVSRLEEDND